MNESFRGINTKVVSMPGATISGFGKRQSTLNVRSKLIEEIKSFEPDFICFALGQVDVELGLYYKRVVKGESIDISSYLDELSEVYVNNIKEIVEGLSIPHRKVCIKGINLSVLTKSRPKAIQYTKRIITENVTEQSEIKKYLDVLRDIYPSNLERYSNHVYFNNKIKSLSEGLFCYFDINDVIEDPSVKGEVHPMYIPAKDDHHLLDSLFVRKIHLDRMLSQLLSI